jgi:hypothetical protein
MLRPRICEDARSDLFAVLCPSSTAPRPFTRKSRSSICRAIEFSHQLQRRQKMKVAEQLLKHIATLSEPHAKAINDAVTAAFPHADPRPMHALVLAHQLGLLLHAFDRDGGDNPIHTVNVILARAGGYMLINTDTGKTNDDKLVNPDYAAA